MPFIQLLCSTAARLGSVKPANMPSAEFLRSLTRVRSGEVHSGFLSESIFAAFCEITVAENEKETMPHWMTIGGYLSTTGQRSASMRIGCQTGSTWL